MYRLYTDRDHEWWAKEKADMLHDDALNWTGWRRPRPGPHERWEMQFVKRWGPTWKKLTEGLMTVASIVMARQLAAMAANFSERSELCVSHRFRF